MDQLLAARRGLRSAAARRGPATEPPAAWPQGRLARRGQMLVLFVLSIFVLTGITIIDVELVLADTPCT